MGLQNLIMSALSSGDLNAMNTKNMIPMDSSNTTSLNIMSRNMYSQPIDSQSLIKEILL